MPAKADHQKQSQFLENTLLPLIGNAKNGLVELFFMDASHFVMGGFVGRLWCKVRIWIKTSSGRKRYNVLGALNFVSKRVETVCNDTYITANQVVEILEKLAAKYKNPIHIILDNARYQKCPLVTQAALRLGITLQYLPTYSPNLNLIERVWKFVKSTVLSAAYFDTFDEYCQRIFDFVDNIDFDNHYDMLSLVTDNFLLFDNCRIA